ncbi:hypothetical protein [Geomonas ferrireducens]|uniref:hypothetical protein n=1 Tax=Geomonas ferrireducens TaxID=2570227 RepID=UPI0010A92A45|nr:hypothetical protein [Geomonas ferrireducens]
MRKRLQRLERGREKLLEATLRNITNGELAALAIQAGLAPNEYEWLLRHPDVRGVNYDFSSMSDKELLAELAAMGLDDRPAYN